MSRAWTRDHQALALQLVAEIDRGMAVAQAELKAARFTDARNTLDVNRKLARLLERLLQAKPTVDGTP